MSQVIRITEKLYNRLKSHAEGFDTPANVIEKILNAYEANGFKPMTTIQEIVASTKLDIEYDGMTEVAFKKALIKNKSAFITMYFTDGTSNSKFWKASKFSEDSNLGANLRSGFLRGWRSKGIYKAVLSFNEPASV